ncbi:site-specific DNA-methyltransferase [bacterium]|nr:site-specific DNA-methyltransferase [bacterium]
MFDKYINQIIHGDCLTIMKNIPDNSVDIAFADPPFNLKKKYNGYKDNKEFDEYLEWCEQWISEMVRITKLTGSIFVHNIPKWLTYYADLLNKIAYFKHWIVWDAPSAPMGKTLLPNHYGILYYTKSAKDFKFFDIRYPHFRCRKCNSLLKDYGGKKYLIHPFGPLCSDVWTDIHRIRHKKRRDEHPCQLPIPLLERLILMSTDENDIVFDPFIGTGTSAIAAKRLMRNFIGIDIDKKYVEIANKNVSTENRTQIGNSYASIYLNKIITIRDKDWDEIKEYVEISDDIAKIERQKNRKKILAESNLFDYSAVK